MAAEPVPRVALRGIRKGFPGVQALDGVDLELWDGEIHALVGENGAGKSTLIKIIAGVHRPDEGTYHLGGEPARIHGPRDAVQSGIRVVYQELELVRDLSVAENVFFGRLPTRGMRVDWARLELETAAVLEQVGLEVSPRARVRRLGIAAQQLVEIARALSLEARVLILDEPTSALSPVEIERLFVLLRRLRDEGVAQLYVSHKLEEIRALADRITVLRDGGHVSTDFASDLDEDEIIRRMVGRELGGEFPRSQRAPEQVVLETKSLTTAHVSDISLSVRAGEIVGLSGLMGAGRTELLRAILGVDHRRAGEVRVAGRLVGAGAAWRMRQAGVGLVPEDRRGQGIFARASVLHNATISCLDQFVSPFGHLVHHREESEGGHVLERMRVRTPSSAQSMALLSGGNQQKVLVARWLLKRDLRVLLVDEPTRGIDVGARFEIYKLLDELAVEGLGILIASSEIEELIGLCERIYVMRAGHIRAELEAEEVTPERLLAAAL
jgi:ABC-type sugar transport system ATPase subunit